MFSDTLKYMEDYRTNRADALNNKKRMRWFTSDVADLKSLQDKFSSKQENTDWQTSYDKVIAAQKEKEQAPKETVLKREAIQMKIAFLSGCRRDMRMMYMAGESDQRTVVDWDRFEYMKLKFHNHKLMLLNQAIQSREGKNTGGS